MSNSRLLTTIVVVTLSHLDELGTCRAGCVSAEPPVLSILASSTDAACGVKAPEIVASLLINHYCEAGWPLSNDCVTKMLIIVHALHALHWATATGEHVLVVSSSA